MSAGKSTMALQIHWQLVQSGRHVELWTFGDRSREPEVTSRIGIAAPCYVQQPEVDLSDQLPRLIDQHVSVIVIDEAQFASMEQVDWLSTLVDLHGIDVYCFGLGADFLLNVFPGSARLFAIADEVSELPVVAYCWCGARGRCNARVVNGSVQRAGAQRVIGDVDAGTDTVGYQVLCRRHYHTGELGPR
jgi:thymidine kinase